MATERPPAGAEAFFGAAWPTLSRFAGLLAAEGELRGLIGPRELPRLWTRHIVNSAAVARFVPPGGTVADVGSGAGFPGIVVAAMRPGAQVHLIETMDRRAAWLREVADLLDLRNVTVHAARAEALHGALSVAVVTARAVAPLDRLARWTIPLAVPGGSVVALKGRRAAEEVETARPRLQKLGVREVRIVDVEDLPGGEGATVVLLHKR